MARHEIPEDMSDQSYRLWDIYDYVFFRYINPASISLVKSGQNKHCA